jgi:hypothetical protein
MGEEVLKPARSLLGRLAAGTLQPTDEQMAVASDPDYLAWLEDLEQAREATANKLADLGDVIRAQEMEPEPPPILRRFPDWITSSSAAVVGFAAEGGGLRGRIARRLAETAKPRWRKLANPPGVYLVSDAEGVRVIWTGSGKPPQVQGVHQGKFRSAKWSPTDRFVASEVWQWIDDRVVLRVGPGEGRKVVLRR